MSTSPTTSVATSGLNVASIETHLSQYLNNLASLLSATLGPMGSTVIIEDRYTNHITTKDGYTVLKNLMSRTTMERVLLDYVKRISSRLVRTVGDGSTSSVIVAAGLAKQLETIEDKLKELPPSSIVKALKVVTDSIVRKLKESAREVNITTEEGRKNLLDVCTVSTNYDLEVAQLIAKIYEEVSSYGLVTVEAGDSMFDSYEIKEGIELNRGMFDKMFATSELEGKYKAEFEHPHIMMVEGVVTAADLPGISSYVNAILNEAKTSLVFICSGYTPEVIDFFYTMLKHNKKMPICLVEFGTNTETSMNLFEDFAAAVGCSPIYKRSKMENIDALHLERLGSADKLIISDSSTLAQNGKGQGTEAYKERVDAIRKLLVEYSNTDSHYDFDDRIALYKLRIARMEAKAAVIRVGGETRQAVDTRKYLIEDATLAARSALRNGIVIGGNTAVIRVMDTFYEEILADLVAKLPELAKDDCAAMIMRCVSFAFVDAYKAILKQHPTYANSDEKTNEIVLTSLNDNKVFNLRSLQYEDIESSMIINSVETDIEITKAALSIISLLLTSKKFVYFPM